MLPETLDCLQIWKEADAAEDIETIEDFFKDVVQELSEEAFRELMNAAVRGSEL